MKPQLQPCVGGIGNEEYRFDFLLESKQLGQNDKEWYSGLTAVKEGKILIMSDDLLTDSLQALSRLLEKHYGQKDLMLIDEYGIPFNNALCSRILISFGIIF